MWDVRGVKQFRFIQEDLTKYTLWLNGDREQMNIEDIITSGFYRIWGTGRAFH